MQLVFTSIDCRDLVAIALGQKLAVLAAKDAELSQHSAVSITACSFSEQITTLCWLAYADPNAGAAEATRLHVRCRPLQGC